MSKTENFIYVELDSNATILALKCTLKDTDINEEDFIGKNWFDTFINISDRDNVIQVFKEVLNTKSEKWKTYKNDIKCLNAHRLIDFTNEVVLKNGQKIIRSKGIEHIDYNTKQM